MKNFANECGVSDILKIGISESWNTDQSVFELIELVDPCVDCIRSCDILKIMLDGSESFTESHISGQLSESLDLLSVDDVIQLILFEFIQFLVEISPEVIRHIKFQGPTMATSDVIGMSHVSISSVSELLPSSLSVFHLALPCCEDFSVFMTNVPMINKSNESVN